MKIIIQKKIFDPHEVSKKFNSSKLKIGAEVTFVGYVRDFEDSTCGNLKKLIIEHYEGMTQKTLKFISEKAFEKWNLQDILIIHRVGELYLHEPIVMIIVVSSHREEAFNACKYIIDYLKIEAPFWKKEESNDHSLWVEQKESDLIKVK